MVKKLLWGKFKFSMGANNTLYILQYLKIFSRLWRQPLLVERHFIRSHCLIRKLPHPLKCCFTKHEYSNRHCFISHKITKDKQLPCSMNFAFTDQHIFIYHPLYKQNQTPNVPHLQMAYGRTKP